VNGLDYSAAAIPGATIKAAGFDFVIRYVEDPAQWLGSKHIRPREYADLVQAGVKVWLVFEVGTGDMLAGHDAGAANARRALAGARWIGYPDDAPIFMACDMHLTAAQLPACLAYIDGAASVLGKARTGVYGFPELIAAAQDRAAWFWQCGHDPGPHGPAHLWQDNTTTTRVGGVACDINRLYRPLAAAQPAAPAAPSRRPGEDTAMLITTPPPADDKTPKSAWPTQRISFGFDPINGWGGRAAIKLHWTAPGGWVAEAKWWVRGGAPGGVGDANQPHSPVAIPLDGVAERFVGLGWELYPPEHADELEVVVAAPGGLHIFPVYER
jgi:hypothetical protein